jgi:primosomal protein N''
MKGKPYDLSQVKMFLGNDKQQLGNMINFFLNEIPSMLDALNEHTRKNDLDEVRFFAHKLKSSIDLFQINGLQTDIRVLEKLAIEKTDIPALQQYVSGITHSLEHVMQEIKNEL